MIHNINAMECPDCKEISLRLRDEEPLDADLSASWVHTYECDECGHIECHVEGVASWYEEGEGCSPQETATEGDDDE